MHRLAALLLVSLCVTWALGATRTWAACWTDLLPGEIGCLLADQRATRPESPAPPRSTSAPCPQWAQVQAPPSLRRYQGKSGLPDPYPTQKGPLAPNVAGIDFWQANHFLVYTSRTDPYLYGDITPFKFDYVKGTLPAYEAAVARYTAGAKSDRRKAVALATQVLPELMAHPEVPPLGPPCPDDRGADDLTLLAGGQGWCNEQSRVFVRLCQVAGIPARLIFLFYTPPRGGHVVAYRQRSRRPQPNHHEKDRRRKKLVRKTKKGTCASPGFARADGTKVARPLVPRSARPCRFLVVRPSRLRFSCGAAVSAARFRTPAVPARRRDACTTKSRLPFTPFSPAHPHGWQTRQSPATIRPRQTFQSPG